MAGKGGGAWKVAYADFVTAMMAFFLVMWIVAQNAPVKESVASYFKDPYGNSKRPPGAPGLSTNRKEGPPPVAKGPRKGPIGHGPGQREHGSYMPPEDDPDAPAVRKAKPLVLTEGDNTSVGTIILFDVESAELEERARKQLKQLAPVLLGKPNKVEIRGHTTRRPLPPGSPYSDPWELSYARCLATKRFLEEQGVRSERIRLSQAGPYEPHALEIEKQDRNARVEVRMLGEFINSRQEAASEIIEASKSTGKPADTKPAASDATHGEHAHAAH